MANFHRLFYDCETSPNIVFTWRTGYKLDIPPSNIIKERAIICVCYKWEHESKIKSIAWNNGDDAELLHEFMEVVNEADEIVAHNGDRFDLKWLRTRCLKHSIPCFPTYKTIDTLTWAKSFYFNSNRLEYISEFLGGKAKISTDFNLWKRVMSGEPSALKEIVSYCKQDVEILEEIYHKLAPYCPHKTNIGVLEGGKRWWCNHCASKNVTHSKVRVTAMGIKRHQLFCNDCKRYFTVSNTVYEEMKNEAVSV